MRLESFRSENYIVTNAMRIRQNFKATSVCEMVHFGSEESRRGTGGGTSFAELLQVPPVLLQIVCLID